MNGELSFFELGVADAGRARCFYGSLFGWEFVDEGSGATIETPNIPGGLHGGQPGANPHLFFRVDDLEAAVQRVRELGGEVGDDLGDDSDTIARFGRFAMCKEDQGGYAKWLRIHCPTGVTGFSRGAASVARWPPSRLPGRGRPR